MCSRARLSPQEYRCSHLACAKPRKTIAEIRLQNIAKDANGNRKTDYEQLLIILIACT
jgi:hypothetical protein